jgi:hypothetical protein
MLARASFRCPSAVDTLVRQSALWLVRTRVHVGNGLVQIVACGNLHVHFSFPHVHAGMFKLVIEYLFRIPPDIPAEFRGAAPRVQTEADR